MKCLSILAAFVALALLPFILIGCSKDTGPTSTTQLSADEQAVQTSLAASDFALPMDFHNDEQYQGQGVSGGISKYLFSQEDGETLPWVSFFRVIKFLPRTQYVIQIPGSGGEGTADVRIINYLRGVFVVDNTDDKVINPFLRAFVSRAVTNVIAQRIGDTWEIAKISPTDVRSENNGGTSIQFMWVSTEGSSNTFPMRVIFAPDTLFNLAELPAFAPGDSVRVRARAFSTNPDGCWLFLHVHGRRAPAVFHLRIPFVRDASDPTLYDAVWVVPAGIEMPRVFFMAVDAIGLNTLFGDATATYNSRMWCFPCLVGLPRTASQ